MNARGLRGSLVPYERTPGRIRFLLLGDSIVFGYGVGQDETLGERLADTLRKDGLPAEVINSGVPAYSIEEEIAFLELDGIRYRPDYVILGFCWNDLNDNHGIRVSSEGWLVSAAQGDGPASHPLWETPATYELRNLVKRSRIAYTAMTGLRSVQENLWPDSHYLFRKSVLEGMQTQAIVQAWERVARNVRRLQELSVQHGFRVLVVALPLPLALEADFPRSSYPKSLAEIAAREGVPFLDLQGSFRGAFRGHDSLFIPYDADHPNGAGHALAAASIRDYLEKNGGLALLISSVRHRPSFPDTPR
ncbi:MAG TPA: SGNH/GDSL hydrolase family protein [Candidatus Polarisedimenticolia bacterium]|nr:SGNH/GDSL hydrolase family protein [Candidatus Polarisedimenticolia bacterium]